MKYLISALFKATAKQGTQWIVKPKGNEAWFKLEEIVPEDKGKEVKDLADISNNYVLEELGAIHQTQVENMLPVTDKNPFAKIKDKKGWYPIEDISDDNVISIEGLGTFDEDEIEDIAA